MKNQMHQGYIKFIVGVILITGAVGYYLYMESSKKGPAKTTAISANSEKNPQDAASRQVHQTPGGVDNAAPVYSESAKTPDQIMRQLSDIRQNPGPEAVDFLLGLLSNKDEAVALEAIDVLDFLANKGIASERCLSILMEKAQDKNYLHRGQALLAAANVGAEQALPAIDKFLQDGKGTPEGKSQANELASRALSLIGTPACIPYLGEIIKNESSGDTKRSCYEALAKVGTAEAEDLLLKQIASTTGKDQAAAVVALSRISNPAVADEIAQGIQNGSIQKDAVQSLCFSAAAPAIFGRLVNNTSLGAEQRVDLLKTIDEYASYAPKNIRSDFTSSLSPLLDNANLGLKKEAITAIVKIGGKEGSDIIFPYIYSDDSDVRRTAFYAYLPYSTPSNYQYLFDFIADENEATRRAAMGMAARFVNNSDRERLEQASTSNDPFISDMATKLLSKMN